MPPDAHRVNRSPKCPCLSDAALRLHSDAVPDARGPIQACRELEPSGLLALEQRAGSPWPVVRLTAPSGFLMENTVIKRLLRDFE